MSELSFLLDLLLNHRLPKATKDLVAARVKEVEARLSSGQSAQPAHAWQPPPQVSSQAPSMQAIMAKNPDLIPPQPVTVVAQTPATAMALQSRQESIARAMSGKPAPGETKPRKF